MEFTFSATPKTCAFEIYGYRKYAKFSEDINFDINDVYGIFAWHTEIAANNVGITDVILTGNMQSVSFTVTQWEDNPEDEVPQSVEIDTSNYEVEFDLDFSEWKTLQPSQIDIDIIAKKITVS